MVEAHFDLDVSEIIFVEGNCLFVDDGLAVLETTSGFGPFVFGVFLEFH